MVEVDCPYKAIMGIACSHRYAQKESKGRGKRGICKYRKDPSECPLYKIWNEQVNNAISQEDESPESFLKYATHSLT